MNKKWISKAFWMGSLLTLLMAEAMLIVAFLKSSKPHSPLGTYYLFVSVFVTTLPWIIGIKGYSVVRRLGSSLDAEPEKARVIWLSHQFLSAAIFAYATVIVNLIFFSTILR
jgi:hypothetical protein